MNELPTKPQPQLTATEQVETNILKQMQEIEKEVEKTLRSKHIIEAKLNDCERAHRVLRTALLLIQGTDPMGVQELLPQSFMQNKEVKENANSR